MGRRGDGQGPALDPPRLDRRGALVDAVRQVQEARAQGRPVHEEQRRRWHAAGGGARFRYVEWIGSGGADGPSSAPPLRMRLRCWYEVIIETGAGKRVVGGGTRWVA